MKKQADVSMPETFEDYMRNARDEFVKFIWDKFSDNIHVRVATENILIAYDQIREKILAGYAAANQPQPHESIEDKINKAATDYSTRIVKGATEWAQSNPSKKKHFIDGAKFGYSIAAAKDGQADAVVCKFSPFEHNKSIFNLGQCHSCFSKTVIDYPAYQDALVEENKLLNETINNQHQLILSAEKRGYDKAMEDGQAGDDTLVWEAIISELRRYYNENDFDVRVGIINEIRKNYKISKNFNQDGQAERE